MFPKQGYTASSVLASAEQSAKTWKLSMFDFWSFRQMLLTYVLICAIGFRELSC